MFYFIIIGRDIYIYIYIYIYKYIYIYIYIYIIPGDELSECSTSL